jgi:hypothetical protein
MITQAGTIRWPELRARGWSKKMRRQFLPDQRGNVNTHVFDLATIVQTEALPEWQAEKAAAIVENSARSARKAFRKAAAKEKARARAQAFRAAELRLGSLLDKVLAEMNATDLAKEYEIARNELEEAIRNYVSETANYARLLDIPPSARYPTDAVAVLMSPCIRRKCDSDN